MVRSLDEIEDEYNLHKKLSNQSYEDLKWHIRHGKRKARAIGWVASISLTSLAPIIAEQLSDSDSFIRGLVIYELLAELELEEYAEKVLKLAFYDDDIEVRDLAIRNLGHILDKIQDKNMRSKIAQFLLGILEQGRWGGYKADIRNMDSAYKSILLAIGIPFYELPHLVNDLKVDRDIDWVLIRKFKDKYL